jgi:antibiotic biosynthesis monooxygenase (ABM) superfamily enzyme
MAAYSVATRSPAPASADFPETPAVARRFSRRFSRPRFALLVLAGVYPLITGLLYIVLPLLAGWPIWRVTLVVAPIMVTIMVWGLIPAVQRIFRDFLNPLAV